MNQESTGLRDGLLIVACIAALIVFARMSAEIIVPLLLSLFIAIVASTPLNWLKARGVSPFLAVIIVVLGIVIGFTLLSMLLGATINQFNQAMPEYQARLSVLLDNIKTSLESHGFALNDTSGWKNLDPSSVMSFTNNFLSGVVNALSNIFLIMLTVIFMLLEASNFSQKITHSEGKNAKQTLRKISDITDNINKYVEVKVMISFGTGLMVWLGLELIGLDFAPMWGLLAFLFNFVPTIGSIIAAVPAAMLALLSLEPAMTAAVVFLYLTVNMVMGNMIEPTIMGRQVGLSTLAVFLSLIFWGWMFGPIGMLLSVLLTMVLKFALEEGEQTRWLAILLSPPLNDNDEATDKLLESNQKR